MEATKGAALLCSSPAGFHPLVEGAPLPAAAKGPPPAAAAAAAAAGGGGGGRGDDLEEEEEQLLLQQQQQQQQRIPKEGEKQQTSSRPVISIKKQIEETQERQRGFLVAVEAGQATVKGIMHAQVS